MRTKSLLTASLLTFVVVSLGVAVADVAGLRSTAPPPSQSEAPAGERWVVYYFHSSTRCATCRQFELNMHDAFVEEVKAGVVDLKVLNYEEPAHRHFAAEFDLAFPSVILARTKDGATIRWKNLNRIWELWNDRPGFLDYVRTELAQFKEIRP